MAHHEPILKETGEYIEGKLEPFSLGFNPFSLESFYDYMGEWGISRGLILWIFFVGLMWILSLEISNLALFATEWIVGTAPLWLPIGLYIAALNAWIWYIQSFYLAGRDGILLEVKMPRDIFKSPRAMELALIPMNLSSGETTFLNRGWQGGVRPFWSFEIASFGGQEAKSLYTIPIVRRDLFAYWSIVSKTTCLSFSDNGTAHRFFSAISISVICVLQASTIISDAPLTRSLYPEPW